MTAGEDRPAFGLLLREWRQRRRVSQLELAIEAGVSARHVSFVETGRARPSREMVLHLAEQLEVPLRERNHLLLAAGFAPSYPQRDLGDPYLDAVRDALDGVLRGFAPNPALVVNRAWELVAGNDATALLTGGVAPHLLAPPVNVLRLSLHPEGLAPRILNLAEWRGHVLARLAREARITGDRGLRDLSAELHGYPGGLATPGPDHASIAVPLRLAAGDAALSLLSTVTTFGTAVDVTVSELSIEAFLPADSATAAALRRGAAPG